jgi:hypothetical protein
MSWEALVRYTMTNLGSYNNDGADIGCRTKPRGKSRSAEVAQARNPGVGHFLKLQKKMEDGGKWNISKATARLLMNKTRQIRGLWMCPRALIAQWLAGQAQTKGKGGGCMSISAFCS